MDGKLLLEAREVAQLLGISLRTLDDLVSKSEAPPHIRLGRVRKWRLGDIHRWIGEQFNNQPATGCMNGCMNEGEVKKM